MAKPTTRNPLIEALPPATDFLTYLTIVEYNLDKSQLPLFHEILQDADLTANIGWDLVHLLIPLLPDSELCLKDVAHLGNPREVILKVTELLEAIGNSDREDEESDAADDELLRQGIADVTDPSNQISSALQFSRLLNMLCILHTRIKTKYPSRFLITSIQALVPAYARLAAFPLADQAVLNFFDRLSESKDPPLSLQDGAVFEDTAVSAPDPEAQPGVLSREEMKLQFHLLQSFLTHVLEKFVDALPPLGESSGMAWVDRYLEFRGQDFKILPPLKSPSTLFQNDPSFSDRDLHVRSILSRLYLTDDELIAAVTRPEILKVTDESQNLSTAAEYPPSRIGKLYALAARLSPISSSVRAQADKSLEMSVFGTHDLMIQSYLGDPLIGNIGGEGAPVIDALLMLGFMTLQSDNNRVYPQSDELFHRYLQRLSILSANSPSPSFRYYAHLLTSAVLRAHESEGARFDFVHDTLEFCPYENLKVSAIEWLKTEFLIARRRDTAVEGEENRQQASKQDSDIDLAIHSTLLSNVACFLFPKINEIEDVTELEAQMRFHLAVLNLYYLLCSSERLYRGLKVAEMSKQQCLDADYFAPLRQLVVASNVKGKGAVKDSGIDTSDLELLEDVLDRVEEVAARAASRDVSLKA